jgi:hypothetical protein
MSHRWISGDADPGDNCLECFACGIAVDFPDGLENEAMWLVPPCEQHDGPSHHFVIVPHVSLEADHWQLECHHYDAAGDEIGLGPGSYNPDCTMGEDYEPPGDNPWDSGYTRESRGNL